MSISLENLSSSIALSVCLSVLLAGQSLSVAKTSPVCLASYCLSVLLSVCLSVYLASWLVCLSVLLADQSLSVTKTCLLATYCMSVLLFVCLSICLSVWLALFVCLSICLSLSFKNKGADQSLSFLASLDFCRLLITFVTKL